MTSHHTSLWSAFVVALMLGVLPSRAADSVKPTADEMAEARRFVAAKFLAYQATPQTAGLDRRREQRNDRTQLPLQQAAENRR